MSKNQIYLGRECRSVASLRRALDDNAASVCAMSAIGLTAVTGRPVNYFNVDILKLCRKRLVAALHRVDKAIESKSNVTET